MRNFAKIRASAQGKKKASALSYVLYWAGAFAFTLWFTWVLFTSGTHGFIGDPVAGAFKDFLGNTAYLFPFIFLYGLVAILVNLKKPHKGVLTLTAGILMILGSMSAIIGLLSSRFGPDHFDGGWLGYFLEQTLSKMFGGVGAGLFSAVILFAGIQVLFKISWQKVLKTVSSTVAADFRDWLQARRELNTRLKNISDKEQAEGQAFEVKPISEPPPVIRAKEPAEEKPP